MTRPETLPTELLALLDAVAASEREATALVADLSEAEVNWQQIPGQSWSIAQCLEHLTLMNEFYLRGFAPLVDQARQKGIGPFNGLSSSAIGRWFVRSQEPPPKRRLKSPAQVVPPSNLARQGLVEKFVRSHDLYRAIVQTAGDVDINRVKGPNPFIKAIKMRISTVLQIIPAHDRRHLWQAANVKRALRSLRA
jgi:hypothetical protein